MKRFVQFTLTYAVLMFIGNLLYDPEYGNFFFLLLTAFGLLYNLAITFWTDTLSKEYKLLSGGFIGAFSCFIIFNGGIITLIYLKDFDFISANRLGRFLNYEMLVKYNNVVALANIFYWFGYRSKFGDKIFTAYHKGLKFDRFLKLDVGVKFPKILIVFGLLVNTILLFNGAFGRGVAEAESFSGPLRILVTFSSYFEKIAMVGYFMLALYFQDREAEAVVLHQRCLVGYLCFVIWCTWPDNLPFPAYDLILLLHKKAHHQSNNHWRGHLYFCSLYRSSRDKAIYTICQ